MRLTSAFVSSAASLAALALGSGALVSGCKSSEAGSRAERPGRTEPGAPIGEAEPSLEGALAQVKNKMSPEEVQEIMGSPSGQTNYPSGQDVQAVQRERQREPRRVQVQGSGPRRVRRSEDGGNMKVVRVDFDPAEDGK